MLGINGVSEWVRMLAGSLAGPGFGCSDDDAAAAATDEFGVRGDTKHTHIHKQSNII